MVSVELIVVTADGTLGHMGYVDMPGIPPVGYIFAEHRFGRDNWYQVTQVMSRMHRDKDDVRIPIQSCGVTIVRINKP